MTKCLTLFRTFPSHIVRNISSASAQGIAYSNSVRTKPILRLFRAMVALSSAMRTLALWPLFVRYQSVSNGRLPDDVFFPSIVRDKKLALDFQWHVASPL